MSKQLPDVIFIPPCLENPLEPDVLGRRNGPDEVAYIRRDKVDSILPVLMKLKNLAVVEEGLDSDLAEKARAAIIMLGGRP